jgi:GxxExxY protein
MGVFGIGSKLRGLPFEQEKPLPVEYKGIRVDCGYRLDFIVAGKVVIELKAVDEIHPVHEAQLLTYLKLTEYRVGLPINFNVPVLKDGIKGCITQNLQLVGAVPPCQPLLGA